MAALSTAVLTVLIAIGCVNICVGWMYAQPRRANARKDDD